MCFFVKSSQSDYSNKEEYICKNSVEIWDWFVDPFLRNHLCAVKRRSQQPDWSPESKISVENSFMVYMDFFEFFVLRLYFKNEENLTTHFVNNDLIDWMHQRDRSPTIFPVKLMENTELEPSISIFFTHKNPLKTSKTNVPN